MAVTIGDKIGRWTVIGLSEDARKVHCRCECGKEADVWKNNLSGHKSLSCGCLISDVTKQRNIKHNGTNTRLYSVWNNMRRRCYEKTNKRYHRYGGRGIKVCEEWKNDFTAFRQWMLSQGYDETKTYGQQTLDRINNDGDYSPENCRLATIQEQNLNRSTRHLLEYNGEIMSITEWNTKMGYPDGCIDNRIRKGWDIERAITEKPRSKKYGNIYTNC